MNNSSGKTLFTAERQMLEAKAAGLPAAGWASGPAPNVGEPTVLAAISALHEEVRAISRLMRGEEEQAAAVAEESVPKGGEVAVLKTEIRALYLAIQRTKSEIAALRPTNVGNDRLIAVSNELDAIVESTESATHHILEAAEKIDNLTSQIEAQAGDGFANRIAEEMRDAVVGIFEACNFQDITGQRITKVVKTLQFVEDRVNKMIDIWGVEAFEGLPDPPIVETADGDDHLLNGPALENEGVSQEDIDKLFG
jgi:chemotaxis protein CheZ